MISMGANRNTLPAMTTFQWIMPSPTESSPLTAMGRVRTVSSVVSTLAQK